ncbi:helix-turn-helix domain-containing protein [Limimaricola pyoseonensis]|uniref:Transcriptional regulator, XRE family n=1 Tax=Limimaricola pyoseonensis TaxID=521013 RepID=A0A1G7J598_9RHOB|nr:helix-turn-helix transcriptional regulator [Limimaricola pyoseonensis]SDF20152.1 transcriptional regulator, XRE family [Limimaricola pyoseonensis]
MSDRGAKLMIGPRLKGLRVSLGLTQAQMAARLGVSSSYVTLMEGNQRPASAKLLVKLAEAFDINVAELAPETDAQLASDLAAALRDPSLEARVGRVEIEQALAAAPNVAAALVRLHDRYRQLVLSRQSEANPLADRDKVEVLEEGSRAVQAVRGWLYARRNHVDRLDRAAEAMAEEMRLHRSEPHTALTERLRGHGVRVRILPAEVMAGRLRQHMAHRQELRLSELLAQPSRRFQMAVLLARLEQSEAIAEELADSGLTDPSALALARVTLANYFAAALLMPYGRFLSACEAARYDVEMLGHRFGASYEQVAHRLTTLQREGARGVPFFFVRVDQAGNISKRFSAGRFPFSSFGGTCPLWNIHAAFEAPDRVQTQVISMPDGARYFSIARTVTRHGGTLGQRATRLAIGLGCDVAYAPRLAHAEGLDLERVTPTGIGVNCYLCERPNCASRAHAPVNRRLMVDESVRGLAIYGFE